MTVVAMKVIDTAQHPDADALRLYTVATPTKAARRIIANLDHVYEIGDIIAIALPGSVLKDGTKIKPSKLRGIYSYGMALGKVKAKVGADLSSVYCQEAVLAEESTKLPFIKWTSIELLHNVKRELDARSQTFQISYCAKVKLHGTNAGVQITPQGIVMAQKRTQIITADNDNAGFAAWVEANADYFRSLQSEHHLTIFGEWCGGGIQS